MPSENRLPAEQRLQEISTSLLEWEFYLTDSTSSKRWQNAEIAASQLRTLTAERTGILLALGATDV